MTTHTNSRLLDSDPSVGAARDLSLLVRRMGWESDGVMSLVLVDAAGDDLPEWQPGAHVDLHLPGGLVRQYSLCGDPQDRHQWRVAVLREPASRGGSHAVHDAVRPGMVLAARGPRNNFALRPAAAYRFVAGGIGITPILSMIGTARAQGATWSLLYGGRSRASMAFLDELGPGEVTVHPQDEVGLLPLARSFATVEPDTLVYACGPEPLLAAVQQATAHWPAGSLVVERFAPVEVDDSAGTGESFEVEAAASGVTVTVEPGTPIIRALEAAGVAVETSCEEGICGTCETRVLSGTPDHRDSLLSAEERAAGETMMVCVSRCLGRKLVLDL